MHDIENEVEAIDDDFDFELEVTDLPLAGKIDHLLAKLEALRAQLTSEMRSRLLFKQPTGVARDEAGDDFELEITDLPESERPALSGIAAPVVTLASHFSPRMRRKRILSVATVGVVAALIVLVVWGEIPSAWNSALSLFIQPTPTPAITSSLSDTTGSLVITGSGRIVGSPHANIFTWSSENGTPQVIPVQNSLGPVPQNCPQNTAQGSDGSPFPSAGGTPLWIAGFDGSGTALTHLTRAKQPGLGWYQQITLMLLSNYAGDVMLQGGDIDDQAPLLFDTVSSDRGVTTLLTLKSTDSSLSNHTIGDESWIVMTTNVYVPAAGCYYLSAQWADGGWTIYFGAGK